METKIYMCWSKDIFLMNCMLLFYRGRITKVEKSV